MVRILFPPAGSPVLKAILAKLDPASVTPPNPYPAPKQYKPPRAVLTRRRRAGGQQAPRRSTPDDQVHESCAGRAAQEGGERDPNEIPPGRHHHRGASLSTRGGLSSGAIPPDTARPPTAAVMPREPLHKPAA
jgi:hypothetical protein